jgi:hypothetical protein
MCGRGRESPRSTRVSVVLSVLGGRGRGTRPHFGSAADGGFVSSSSQQPAASTAVAIFLLLPLRVTAVHPLQPPIRRIGAPERFERPPFPSSPARTRPHTDTQTHRHTHTHKRERETPTLSQKAPPFPPPVFSPARARPTPHLVARRTDCGRAWMGAVSMWYSGEWRRPRLAVPGARANISICRCVLAFRRLSPLPLLSPSHLRPPPPRRQQPTTGGDHQPPPPSAAGREMQQAGQQQQAQQQQRPAAAASSAVAAVAVAAAAQPPPPAAAAQHSLSLSPPSATMMGRMDSVWRHRTCVRQHSALNLCLQQQQQQQAGGGNAATLPASSSGSGACGDFLNALRTCDLHAHQPTSLLHRPHF